MRLMGMMMLIPFLVIAGYSYNAPSRNATGGLTMQIKISFGDTSLTATMLHNPTTRDFLSKLPMELKLEDYAGTEKISKLPGRLTIQDAPAATDASKGDITYYSPWGNLAIFYRDFGSAKGLVRLGKIDSGLEILVKACEAPCNVRIERL